MTSAVAIPPQVLQVPIDGLLYQVHSKTASQITVAFGQVIDIHINMWTTGILVTTWSATERYK